MESIGIKGHALVIAPSITMLMRDLDSMAMESASRQYSVPVGILYFSAASSQDKGVFKNAGPEQIDEALKKIEKNFCVGGNPV